MKDFEIRDEIERSFHKAIKELLLMKNRWDVNNFQIIITKVNGISPLSFIFDLDQVMGEKLIELNVKGKVRVIEIRDGEGRDSAFDFDIRPASLLWKEGTCHVEVDKLRLKFP